MDSHTPPPRLDEPLAPVTRWTAPERRQLADSVVRVRINQYPHRYRDLHGAALEIVVDILAVLDAHEIDFDDIPAAVDLSLIALEGLRNARERIDSE